MTKDLQPNVPTWRKPKIIGKRIVAGVLYYIGENGQHYIAEMFDKFFQGLKMKVNPNRYTKGDMIGNGALWQ